MTVLNVVDFAGFCVIHVPKHPMDFCGSRVPKRLIAKAGAKMDKPSGAVIRLHHIPLGLVFVLRIAVHKRNYGAETMLLNVGRFAGSGVGSAPKRPTGFCGMEVP